MSDEGRAAGVDTAKGRVGVSATVGGPGDSAGGVVPNVGDDLAVGGPGDWPNVDAVGALCCVVSVCGPGDLLGIVISGVDTRDTGGPGEGETVIGGVVGSETGSAGVVGRDAGGGGVVNLGLEPDER